jgi:hypothetical protein
METKRLQNMESWTWSHRDMEHGQGDIDTKKCTCRYGQGEMDMDSWTGRDGLGDLDMETWT